MDNKKIRWGIISTGWIAHKMASALQVVDGAELYAVGSRSIETARTFAEEYSKWTPNTLEKRAVKLAKWALARWPN